MSSHEQAVREQFDSRAQAYLTSAVHAGGPDLECAARLVAQSVPSNARGLDLGCGAGHLSFRLAPLLGSLIAVDPAPRMLATVAQAAAQRGLTGLLTCRGSAESLPFAAASFELLATRYSAHHWTRLPAALSEMARLCRPGGWLLLIDTLGLADALMDTHLQAMELLRDRSHVRNRSLAEWTGLLAAAGFELLEQHQWPTRIEFGPWIERMHTPAEHVTAIRSLQQRAPSPVQQALGLEDDGTFVLQTALLWARLARGPSQR